MRLTVEWMTCQHCVRAIVQVIARLGGRAYGDLRGGTVDVDGVGDVEKVRGLIKEEGYRAVDVA